MFVLILQVPSFILVGPNIFLSRADNPITYKSESLNLLEPSGPVQAYNGTAVFQPQQSPLTHLCVHFQVTDIIAESEAQSLQKKQG